MDSRTVPILLAQLKLLAEVVKTLKKDDSSEQKLSEDANKDKAKAEAPQAK